MPDKSSRLRGGDCRQDPEFGITRCQLKAKVWPPIPLRSISRLQPREFHDSHSALVPRAAAQLLPLNNWSGAIAAGRVLDFGVMNRATC